MTSMHMLPASDPASVESFLRVRNSQLLVGPFRVRPERRYDADRLRRDLASIREAGRDPRVLAARLADGADEREELRRLGWTNERLDRAAADLRDDLQRRVHSPAAAAVTAGGGALLSSVGALSTPPAVASGRQGRTARDLAGMAGNIAAARRAGLDPAKLWPGQAGLPGRPSPPKLVAAAGPERSIYGAPVPVAASSSPFGGRTASGPVRRAPGGRRRR
jgi:hypothetical protein